jgi:hypothetical protein
MIEENAWADPVNADFQSCKRTNRGQRKNRKVFLGIHKRAPTPKPYYSRLMTCCRIADSQRLRSSNSSCSGSRVAVRSVEVHITVPLCLGLPKLNVTLPRAKVTLFRAGRRVFRFFDQGSFGRPTSGEPRANGVWESPWATEDRRASRHASTDDTYVHLDDSIDTSGLRDRMDWDADLRRKHHSRRPP